MEKEYRYIEAELRANEDGVIEGYAALFDVWSLNLGWFKEKIQAGAFTKTLESADVRALFNHDPNFVLGRNTAGTLELVEDDRGLFFRTEPPAAQWAQDLLESINRGDINQASFAFSVVSDKWNKKQTKRELIEVELYDVSPVTYPAYPQTSVSARSLANMLIDRAASGGMAADELRELQTSLAAIEDNNAGSADVGRLQARHANRRRFLELLRR